MREDGWLYDRQRGRPAFKPRTERLLGILAVIGLAAALVVHLLTFAHIHLRPIPLIMLMHIGMFAVFAPFAYAAHREFGPLPQLEELRLPRWALMLLVGAAAYMVITLASLYFLADVGTPDIRDGRFVLHERGKLIREITAQEYDARKSYQLRLFSALWHISYLAPALYFLFRVRRA